VTSNPDLRGRDFLAEQDFTADELDFLIDLAGQLKAERAAGVERQRLTGRGLALIFEKTSTRTRISFEAAIAQQGGFSTDLGFKLPARSATRSPSPTPLSVLSRVYDGIEYRGSDHCHRSRSWRPTPNRSGVQWADRHLASDADAGRLPDNARAHRDSRSAAFLRLRRRCPHSTWATRC
jgi:hypothetical protein